MNWKNPKISSLGDRSILLQWDFGIDREKLYWLLRVKQGLEKLLIKQDVEIINTYNSILISYIIGIEDAYTSLEQVKQYDFNGVDEEVKPSRIYSIPVCYDPEFAPDLNYVATRNNLKTTELISLHTAPVYTLFFIGFLPGFLYLGGMDERLSCPRKEEPRKRIEKGAVGIAGNQTGIYPNSSPGGWQIIGNCPLSFFDPAQEIPSPFNPGDQISFEAVSRKEYDHIKSMVEAGQYILKPKHLG